MAKSDSRSGVATAAETPIIPVAPAPPAKQKRKERTPVDPNETNRAKFLRLARRRIPKAVKAIEQAANLFRRNQYDCDEGALIGTEKLFREALAKLRANWDGGNAAGPVSLPFLTEVVSHSNGPAQ